MLLQYSSASLLIVSVTSGRVTEPAFALGQYNMVFLSFEYTTPSTDEYLVSSSSKVMDSRVLPHLLKIPVKLGVLLVMILEGI